MICIRNVNDVLCRCAGLVFFICISPPSLAQSCHSIDSVEWLLGDWVADDGSNITIESWQKVSADTFEGVGESRGKKSNKLKSSEALRLVKMGNEVFYLAKPRQNDLPVAFKLTRCSGKRAVFENPMHDFPQKLDYQWSTEDKMIVTVSGSTGRSFSIQFVR